MSTSITLLVNEQTETLNPDELAGFIFLFRAAYGLACRELREERDDELQDVEEQVGRVIKAAKKLRLEQLQRLFNEAPQGEDLQVTTISRRSPLEIALAGTLICLAVAVILSGGKLKGGPDGFEAELRPLGDGIKKLREGLGLSSQVTTGYSVQVVVVRLSTEEFRLLMESVRGQGGFQSFFAELQHRINKSTRRLPLYPPDIDRICRHGREPKKGGFQAKLRKVFGRHFSL
jgi:hypothetical protein